MRTYTYAPGDIPKVLEAWAKAVPAREELSPLAACWTSELGGLEDLRQRTSVRAAMAQDTALAQLPGGGDLIAAMESEIMNPAPFMQPHTPSARCGRSFAGATPDRRTDRIDPSAAGS